MIKYASTYLSIISLGWPSEGHWRIHKKTGHHAEEQGEGSPHPIESSAQRTFFFLEMINKLTSYRVLLVLF